MSLSTFSFDNFQRNRKFVSKDRLLAVTFLITYFLLAFNLCWYPSVKLVAVSLIILGLIYFSEKRYRKIFNMIFFSGVLFMILGELCFRLQYFGVEGIAHFRDYVPAGLGHPLTSLRYDPASYTGIAPNQQGWMRGKPFNINSLGFRDKERSFEKKPGSFRIVVLGTSLSMGIGVGQDETYAAYLEEALNHSSASPTYEVINLARGGYGVDDMLDVLEKIGKKFDPDIVILEPRWTSQGLHAIPPFQKPRSLLQMIKKYFSQEYVGAVLFFYEATHREYARIWADKIISLKNIFLKNQDATQDLNQLIESYLVRIKEQAAGKRVFILILRPMEQLYRSFYIDQKLKELCQKYQLPLIDTSGEDYGKVTHEMIIYPGDHHPNPRANRIYAGSIYRQLKGMGY